MKIAWTLALKVTNLIFDICLEPEIVDVKYDKNIFNTYLFVRMSADSWSENLGFGIFHSKKCPST